MKNLSNASIAGLAIEMLAGLTMAILVLAHRAVPDVLAWIFGVGLIITLASCVFTSRKQNQ